MIVAHNLAAMNGGRQLGIVTNKKAKSAEKLGSGYKINRAADDAAGLTISEKMRSQVRGLDQASANCQDGVSLVQIAEGAMGETTDILHRMTELVIKSANGTNTEEDRSAIQKEVSQLTEELNRISESTEFNTMKLLDGSISKNANPEAEDKLLGWVKGSWIKDGLDKIRSATGWSLSGSVNIDVQLKSMGNSTMASMASTMGGSNFILSINRDMLTGGTSFDHDGPVSGGSLFDRIMTHEMTHALMYHNDNSEAPIPLWFTEGVAEAVHGDDDYRFGTNGNSSVQGAYNDLMAFDFNHSSPEIDCYSVGMLAVGYMEKLDASSWSSLITKLNDPANNGKSFSQLVDEAYSGATPNTMSGILSSIKSQAQTAYNNDPTNLSDLKTFFTDKCGFTIGDAFADSLDGSHTDASGAVPNSGSEQAISSPTETVTINGVNITFNWPDTGANHAMIIQCGPSADQTIEFGIGAMNSSAIFGSEGFDASTQDSAKKSIKRIEEGLEYVSSERSKLGAVQNRLEHTILNLDQTSENTSAAESRIRDVDMADEMVEYSKNQILQQAGISMLTQMNRSTEGVLSLLQ